MTTLPYNVQKESITARIIQSLYERDHTVLSLASSISMTPSRLSGYVNRMVRRGLMYNDRDVSLTAQGRWCAIALSLNLVLVELAAASIIYVQLKQWDQCHTLRSSNTAKFAARDHASLIKIGYKRSTARMAYSRLIKAGIIYRVSNGGIVAMSSDTISTLERYDVELRSLHAYLTDAAQIS